MRKTLLSALAVAALLSAPWTVRAADEAGAQLKPLVVVSLSGYDEILADLQFLGKLGDDPQLAKVAEDGLKEQLGVDDLKGLDRTRPWGLVLQSDGEEFPVYGFVPVTNLKDLLKSLESVIGKNVDPKDGVYEFDLPNRKLFLTERKGWALLADSAKNLAKVPSDPAAVLGDLPKTHDLAVQLLIKNVPDQLRQTLQGLMQFGLQAGLQRQENESDEEYSVRRQVTQQAVQQFIDLVNDLDTLQIGVSLDRKAANASLEYLITARPGTKTAEQMVAPAEQKTAFGGLALPGAALTLNTVGKIPESQAAQFKSAITQRKADTLQELENQGLTGEQLEQAKRLVNELMDVLIKTVEKGQLDLGLSLLAGPETLSLAAGGTVAETGRLEKVLRDVVAQLAKDEPEAAKAIKLDAAKHQGVSFHTISVPTESLDADKLPGLIGKTLDIVLGIGEDRVYVSAGRDAVETLKKAIDRVAAEPAKMIPPMVMNVSATPLVQLAASLADDARGKANAQKILDLLKKSPGKDQIVITSVPVPNGAKVRLEVQEGLLRVVGAARVLADE